MYSYSTTSIKKVTPPYKKSRLGFTLIEILISLSIGAVLLGGITGFLISGLEATKKTGDRIQQNGTQRTIEQIFNNLQLGGITDIQPTSSTGYFIFTNTKNYLLEEATGSTYCEDGRELTFLQISEIIKNGAYEPKTASGGQFTIGTGGLEVLSGGIRLFGTNIPGGKITANEPLYSELGGASSLSHSGNILIITDSINNRLILQDTQNTDNFEVVDTLDFGIEHPIFTGFTASGGIHLIGNKKAIYLEDIPTGSFTGYIQLAIENKSGIGQTITEIRAIFSGSNVLSAGAAPTITCGPGSTCTTDIADTYTISGDSVIYTFGTGANIISGDILALTLNGVNLNYLTGSGRDYLGEIRALSGSTNILSDIFYYSTVGDGNLFTSSGNIITQTGTGTHLRRDSSGNNYQSGALFKETTQKIQAIERIKSPSKNLKIQETSDGKGYQVSYQRYQNYECKNSENILREEAYYIKKTD